MLRTVTVSPDVDAPRCRRRPRRRATRRPGPCGWTTPPSWAQARRDAPPVVAGLAVPTGDGATRDSGVGPGGARHPEVLVGEVGREVGIRVELVRLDHVGAHEGDLHRVEHRLDGVGAQDREERGRRDRPRAEATDHAGKAAAGGFHEGVGALAGLLEHLAHEGAAVDAGDGALGVNEAARAGRLLDAQVADVDEAREDALLRQALDDVGELALGGALRVVHDAHDRAVGVVGAGVGVGPGGVGLAQGGDDAVGDVEGSRCRDDARQSGGSSRSAESRG